MGLHMSSCAGQLLCAHCGKRNESKEWPIRGDEVAFYYQRQPGNHSLTVTCPHCSKLWYVVWDDDPGPVRPLQV